MVPLSASSKMERRPPRCPKRLCGLCHCLATQIGDQDIALASAAGLKVVHRGKRCLMRSLRRSRHAVFDYATHIVALMRVCERVVHADVAESAHQQQGCRFEAAQQNLQIGPKKTGIAALADPKII